MFIVQMWFVKRFSWSRQCTSGHKNVPQTVFFSQSSAHWTLSTSTDPKMTDLQYTHCKKVGFLLKHISLVTHFAVGVDVRACGYFFCWMTKCLRPQTVFFNLRTDWTPLFVITLLTMRQFPFQTLMCSVTTVLMLNMCLCYLIRALLWWSITKTINLTAATVMA